MLLEIADAETGLGQPRLENETRADNRQLRIFANLSVKAHTLKRSSTHQSRIESLRRV